MRLQIGNFLCDSGECSVVISKQALTENGRVWGYTERWDVQGMLIVGDTGNLAANQAAVSAAIEARQYAWLTPGIDLLFLLDDGELSAHYMKSTQTKGGLRVVQPVSFPQGRGAEYCTWRNWTAAMECDYLDPSLTILDWTESLQFAGGGPQWGYLLTLNGSPQQQLLRQQTSFKCVQQGDCVGISNFVPAPAPIFPGAEHVDQRKISFTSPKRFGRGNAASYRQFRTSWAYYFESDQPLSALPTPQVSD